MAGGNKIMFRINRQKVKVFKLMLTAVFMMLFGLTSSAAEPQTAKKVEDLVKSLSGSKLKVETKAVPYQLVGDFNGDKIKDVAVIVSLSDTVKNIAKTVKIEYPYYSGKEVDAEDLALFVIHGAGKGWQFAQKSSVLFLGRSSALIFQKSRLGEHGENGNNWEIEKDKRGRERLFFATEGSDGTLKWNGKKYIWTETNP